MARAFAAEIGSVNNTREQQQQKRGRYAQFLRPVEILETEPINDEDGEVLTRRRAALARHRVAPSADAGLAPVAD